MINFEITKEDVLNSLCEKIISAIDDKPYQNEYGEYIGGNNKYLPLLNETINHISASVTKELWKEHKKKLDEKIEEKVGSELTNILNKTFQPVNQWGEKVGEKTTVKDIFEKRSRDFWLQKVDANGKATDSWSAKMTRAEFIANQQMAESFRLALSSEFDVVVNELKKSLKVKLGEVAKDEIDKSLKKLVY